MTNDRGSDEIRRSKPTPQMEARGGMAIVETVLWDAVPSYLRKLNAQCVDSLGPAYQLPLDTTPIQFSSWMGGDRDGNPNVTPKVTYEVSLTQRLQAANLILKDISNLYDELAICKGFSTEMLDLANQVKQSSDRLEKYRRVLGFLQRRLQATIKWCETELVNAANPATLSQDLAAVKVRPFPISISPYFLTSVLSLPFLLPPLLHYPSTSSLPLLLLVISLTTSFSLSFE
jgi:phosphoenolpyruvate carboxylase